MLLLYFEIRSTPTLFQIKSTVTFICQSKHLHSKKICQFLLCWTTKSNLYAAVLSFKKNYFFNYRFSIMCGNYGEWLGVIREMKSFSRLLLPRLSPAAATWQGAAEAIEGPENAHKYRKKSPWLVHRWIPTLSPTQSKATRDPGSHTSDLPSCKWPVVFSSLTSLLPLALHVPAKEQECEPCRAPDSSEMSSSDDKTYLKTLNLRKIKEMTRCSLQNSIRLVKY